MLVRNHNQRLLHAVQFCFTLRVAHHLAKLKRNITGQDNAESNPTVVGLLQVRTERAAISIGEDEHQLALSCSDEVDCIGQCFTPPTEVPEPSGLLLLVEWEEIPTEGSKTLPCLTFVAIQEQCWRNWTVECGLLLFGFEYCPPCL